MRGTQRCTAIDALVFDTNDGLKLMDKTIHFQCQKASQWTDDWIFIYAFCNKLGRSWEAVFPENKSWGFKICWEVCGSYRESYFLYIPVFLLLIHKAIVDSVRYFMENLLK